MEKRLTTPRADAHVPCASRPATRPAVAQPWGRQEQVYSLPGPRGPMCPLPGPRVSWAQVFFVSRCPGGPALARQRWLVAWVLLQHLHGTARCTEVPSQGRSGVSGGCSPHAHVCIQELSLPPP